MIDTACLIAVVGICVGLLLNLYRLMAGPDIADRILALDTMVINAIGLIVLAGIRYGTALYFEAALLFSLFGFVSTVAFCKFILRGKVIE